MLLKNSFVNLQMNVLCFANDNVKLFANNNQTSVNTFFGVKIVTSTISTRNLKNLPDGFLQNQSHCDNGRRRWAVSRNCVVFVFNPALLSFSRWVYQAAIETHHNITLEIIDASFDALKEALEELITIGHHQQRQQHSHEISPMTI